MTEGTRYLRVVFDASELDVIRAACASVSAKEQGLIDDMADADLEQFALQAKRAFESDMAHKLVSLFKAGQEILIEPEDLAPIMETLKIYRPGAQDEHALALQGAIEKIERCCGPG
jgi:hypothetical protein